MAKATFVCLHCKHPIVGLELSGKAGAVGLAEPEEPGNLPCETRGQFEAASHLCQVCDDAEVCAAETVAAMKAARTPAPDTLRAVPPDSV